MKVENHKLIAMLQYLEDWDKLTRTIVTHVEDYRMGLLAFQNDVEALPDVKLNLVDENQEPVWLDVPRLRKDPSPDPSEELRPWIVIFDDPSRKGVKPCPLTLWESGRGKLPGNLGVGAGDSLASGADFLRGRRAESLET